MVKKLFIESLTNPDSILLYRLAFVIAIIVFVVTLIAYLFLSAWDVYDTHDFKPLEFGGGLASIFSGGGVLHYLMRYIAPKTKRGRKNA